ncbi:MAG TPA: alpha/beta fold hydrolase [Terriglobales bacterium]|jgi:dienelactone hydrolase|nr:alpha/beta fold hydrolase [Terriglobales bacterium]
MKPLAAALLLFCALAQAQSPSHETVFYSSGALKIEAYVYKPEGKGPWPAILYNHGSREGQERQELPMPFIAEAFVPAGYVVFVVERRGYGKSEGTTFSDDVRGARDQRYVARLDTEVEDVLAATDWLKQQPYVFRDRVVVMGWSLGGIMTVLAAGRRTDYCAAIDQAAGALSWKASPELQAKLKDAAARVRVPLLSMVAENDAQTEGLRTIDSLVPAPTPHKAIVYPPFHPAHPRPGVADGHLLFGPANGGIALWQADTLAWIHQYCH